MISGAQSLQRPRSRPNQEKSGSGVGAELLDPGGRSKIEPWPVLGIRANDSIRGRGCGRLSLGSRPAQGNPAQYEKISKTFRRLPLTQRRLKAIGCSWRCTASFLPWIHCLPNVCVLCTLLHSVLPSKGELQPRHVSRGGARCFELLVNEADPVAGPRTTKVSETPLNLKNAQLLKCCQPAACLKHLSALNARELFCRDLMPLLQQQP